jgi:SAM-dependent methyltransferase
VSVDEEIEAARVRWNAATGQAPAPQTRWWQHAPIRAHINRRIGGSTRPGIADGDIDLLRTWLAGRVLRNAISIGSGNGKKEIELLRAGIVEQFELYEISERRIAEGESHAARHNVTDRIRWRQEVIDFDTPHPGCDMVYWNNALHHMLDTANAVEWSKRSLNPRGVMYVNDFVGPDRMQWTPESLELASAARALLPDRLLAHPKTGKPMSRAVRRPDAQRLKESDPTECADSAAILPAIRRHFPGAFIRPTGGVVYHSALNDVIANFTPDDEPLLKALLLLDDAYADAGHTHYAVALCPTA